MKVGSVHAPHYGRSAYARIPNDAYLTIDERCGPVLTDRVQLRSPVHEGAVGKWHLARQLMRAGVRQIIGSDILRYGPTPKGCRFFQANYLTLAAPPTFDGVPAASFVTNPPNKQSTEFAEHALHLMLPIGGMVALLVPLAWDAAPSRRHLTRHPSFRLRLPLPFRPWWTEERKVSQAREIWQWLVWDGQHAGGCEAGYA